VVSAGVFYMDLTNYVAFGTYQTTLLDIRHSAFATYTISAPINSSGKSKGVELAWQQPLGWGFGAMANYTYADAKEDNGAPLVGASKNTYNLGAYYEDHGFGARLSYTYRSAFFVGLDRSTPQFQDDTGVLSAALSYTLNKNVSFNLDMLNLNDPVSSTTARTGPAARVLRERPPVLLRREDQALGAAARSVMLPGVEAPFEGGTADCSALFSSL
jgi:Outer membrane receptor proteins, mostly Fe transport